MTQHYSNPARHGNAGSTPASIEPRWIRPFELSPAEIARLDEQATPTVDMPSAMAEPVAPKDDAPPVEAGTADPASSPPFVAADLLRRFALGHLRRVLCRSL